MSTLVKHHIAMLYVCIGCIIFVPLSLSAKMVVNEIVYKSGLAYDSGDWVELFNSSDTAQDISNWRIEDDGGNYYIIPASTVVNPYDYIVIYSDSAFLTVYPSVTKVRGPSLIGFGKTSDSVILYNALGEEQDTVDYEVGINGWPNANGNNRSIELIYPYNSNNDPASWALSATAGGTPGAKNTGAVGIAIDNHNRSPDGPTSSQMPYINLTARDAFSTLTSVIIHVQYGTGGYSSTQMTPGANDLYSITLPATNDGMYVRYYFSFANAAGQTMERWWNGNSEPYLYRVQNSPVYSGMVINEIMYNSSNIWDDGSGILDNYEYVEIYNYNSFDVDISYWQFHDDGNKYRLPADITLPANGFAVLADKTQAVLDVYGPYPHDSLLISFPDIGLANSGEQIRWQNVNGENINDVTYTDDPPWPTTPDGDGPSLELFRWDLDNSLPANWRASTGFGTPGRPNSTIPEPVSVLAFISAFCFLLHIRRIYIP